MAALSADSPAVTRILAAIRAVPRGSVAGYGQIALRAGLPRRARMVARVLAGNADPDLPWHLILRSDGRIAFPPGSRGFREQVRRLRAGGWPGTPTRTCRGTGSGAATAGWRSRPARAGSANMCGACGPRAWRCRPAGCAWRAGTRTWTRRSGGRAGPEPDGGKLHPAQR